jgi:DUF1365 family protein
MSAASQSCIYDGWVRHRRFLGVTHELRTRYFTAYLDLDELPELFDSSRLWSARGRAIVAFRREDHLGDPSRPLADEVRALVAARTGRAPAGPIRLLTNLRYFGHCFNPVSFFYCFDRGGERVETIVAEVTNTPWGERHAYVLEPAADRPPGGVLHGSFAKEFHVSPFMGMDHTYSWRLTEPGEQLIAHIESNNDDDGELAFDATLSLRRRDLSAATMRRLLARHPMITLRSLRQIYGHGLRLKLKGARYFPNPSGAPLIGRRRRRHARSSREQAARSSRAGSLL